MKSEKYSESSRLLLPPMKQTTSLVSDRLTKSEIEWLRQRKKQISDYARKELSGKIRLALNKFLQQNEVGSVGLQKTEKMAGCA
jgi:uncharacterized membrane-anchored protein YhcB (DUF1043 family)